MKTSCKSVSIGGDFSKEYEYIRHKICRTTTTGVAGLEERKYRGQASEGQGAIG
jgi:hypothetical protein